MNTTSTIHKLLWAASLCVLACGGERDRSLDGTVTGSATLVGSTDHSGIEATLAEGKQSALSAADGHFIIPDVRLGVYTLTLRKDAFEETIPNVLVLPGHTGLYLGTTMEPLRGIELQRGRRLLQGQRASHDLRLSPDKKRIFFLSADEDGNMALYTALATDREPQRLTGGLGADSTGGNYPYPSGAVGDYVIAPDGLHVAVRAMVDTEDGPVSQMLVISTERGKATVLEDAQTIVGFSPKGRHLLFVAQAEPGQPPPIRIAKLGADEVTFKTLPIQQSPYGYYGPPPLTFSSNGTHVLVPTQTGISVVDLETSGVKTIAANPGAGFQLSPDGEAMLFLSAQTTYPYRGSLSIARLASGEVQQLATNVPQFYGAFSPTSDRVAFLSDISNSYPQTAKLRVARIADAQVTTVLESAPFPSRFQFSGDGKQLLIFQQTPYGPPELKVVGVDGGAVHALGIANNYVLSSDGMRVAFLGGFDTRMTVLKAASLATGEVFQIASDVAPEFAFSFAPDSARIVYYARPTQGGQVSLKSCATTGGESITLLANASQEGRTTGRPLQFSPDGKRLLWYATTAGSTRSNLQVIPLEGGKPLTLISNVRQAAWRSDGTVISERLGTTEGLDLQRAIYASDMR